jgi:uncharacterized protein
MFAACAARWAAWNVSGKPMSNGIFVGGGGDGYALPQNLLLKYGNRHGLIAGATGTGKTVTLQVLAEGFSAAGVPVFLSDIKGDLAGLGLPGDPSAGSHAAFERRNATIGFADFAYRGFPVTYWDLFGQTGHPVRTTVAEMGPLLLSRMLDLTEAQEGVINIAFRLADEEGLPLLDMKDLQSMLVWMGQNARELSLRYGSITAASVGAIQRRLLVLETQGGAELFGEPALELFDLMTCDAEGFGRINILSGERLMQSPRLYATFLLWLLSQLFEDLPEVGNPEKPKLVFFFDEAHLLFRDAPRALVEKVEQVARLIRSKGVGVYFCTQNPADVPEAILGQLGNRVQHALRAFTARDQKALRMAAQTYRDNPRLLDRRGDPRGRHGRGRDLVSGGQGHPRCCRAHADPPALVPDGADHGDRAHRPNDPLAAGGEIRHRDRQRERARTACPSGRGGGARGRGGGGPCGARGRGRPRVSRGPSLRAEDADAKARVQDSRQPQRHGHRSLREVLCPPAWQPVGAGDGARHPGQPVQGPLRAGGAFTRPASWTMMRRPIWRSSP